MDVTKVMTMLPIGGELLIPHRVLSEACVRQRCVRLNKKNYRFKASVLTDQDACLVTRIK